MAFAGSPDENLPPGRPNLTPLAATTDCPDAQRAYQELRDRHGQIAPVELEPGVTAWLVLGYPECLAAARQEWNFSSDPRNWRSLREGQVPPDSRLGPLMFPRGNASFADGERHRRLRAPLEEAISAVDERSLRRDVSATCASLIGAFGRDRPTDLVAGYAAVVPLSALAGLFGIGASDAGPLRRALIALFGSGKDSLAGNRQLEDIIGRHVAASREMPGDDLTTRFLRHPGLRDDGEIVQSIALLISAGYGATTTWIALTLRLLLTDPQFSARVLGGRLNADEALDEVLWRDPPLANMPGRYALRDGTLSGRQIRRGDALILGLAAAHGDPRAGAGHPAREPGNRAHLAWGAGPHACPAQSLARIITRTAVETALNLLPGLQLAIPASELAPQPSPWARCPASLPVRFTPPAAGMIAAAAAVAEGRTTG